MKAYRALTVAAAAALLAACVHSPPPGAEPAPEAVALPPLRPLARQPGTPADAPRSRVPEARYDLAIGRTEDEMSLDDGLPGDEPPGEIFQRGGASWYGLQFYQRLTANGERFDMGALTAAHKTLPFHTRVCVRSLVNGREVLVRINDRGPFVANRVIDLSRAAAEAIGMIELGIKQVALTLIGTDGGRCAGEAVPGVSAPAPGARPVTATGNRPAASVRRAAPVRRAAKAKSVPTNARARR